MNLHPESMKVDLPSTLCWARLARVDLFTREGSLAISRPITKLPNPSSGPIGTPTVVFVKTISFMRYTALVPRVLEC